MKIHTLFQYIFDIPVNPARVLLSLYISPVSTPYEICERSGISRSKIYKIVRFLEKDGFVDRSERGIIKLKTDMVEPKLIEGINELIRMANDLVILKKRAVKEEKEAVLQKLDRIEKLEKNLMARNL